MCYADPNGGTSKAQRNASPNPTIKKTSLSPSPSKVSGSVASQPKSTGVDPVSSVVSTVRRVTMGT